MSTSKTIYIDVFYCCFLFFNKNKLSGNINKKNKKKNFTCTGIIRAALIELPSFMRLLFAENFVCNNTFRANVCRTYDCKQPINIK